MTSVVTVPLPIPGREPVRICLPEHFDALAHEIRRGTYSPSPTARLLCDLCEPGVVVADLGAHLGTVALAASAHGATVVAVEASPGNAACLRSSIRANNFENLHVIEAAASDHSGWLTFCDQGPYGRVTTTEGSETLRVRAATATSLLKEVGIDHLDLVKLDVEGHELAALDGLAPLLERSDAPSVIFESNRHMLHQSGGTVPELLRRFAEFGYRLYLIEENELVESGSNVFQAGTVVDYFATRGNPPWPSRSPFTLDELAKRVTREASSSLVHSRTSIARALLEAPGALLDTNRVRETLAFLALDPDPAVTDAVAWWSASPSFPNGGHDLEVIRYLAMQWNTLTLLARALHTRINLTQGSGAPT